MDRFAGHLAVCARAAARRWSAVTGTSRTGRRIQKPEIQPEEQRLPARRACLAGPAVRREAGWIDVWRRLYPEDGEACYTWWSNRGQAWAKNVGWRLDYHVACPGFAGRAQAGSVYKARAFPTMRR